MILTKTPIFLRDGPVPNVANTFFWGSKMGVTNTLTNPIEFLSGWRRFLVIVASHEGGPMVMVAWILAKEKSSLTADSKEGSLFILFLND